MVQPIRAQLLPARALARRKAQPAAASAPSPGARAVDVARLAERLRESISGEVRFEPADRGLYATDASNYRHVPLGVCIPRSSDDVVEIVRACREAGVPVVSRAGGTGLAGQTNNVGVVIDWSKHANQIVSLDPQSRTARVEPGVICDQLADAVRPFGLTYGPKPATHTHCCYGGMLSNNSCGIHAQMAGKAVDNTEAMDVLLYDGTRMSVGWMTDAEFVAAARRPGREGQIYARLASLRDRYRRLIEARYPKIPRRVSGYNLDSLLPGPDGRLNVARALVGSEGTCVTMLEMTVRLVPDPPKRALVVLGYPDIYRAADHLTAVLASSPIGLEGIDNRLREHIATKNGPHAKFLELLPDGDGYLFVEYGGESDDEARSKAEALLRSLRDGANTPSSRLVTDPKEQRHLWDVRESGLGATAFVPGQPDTWTGFEDSAVDPSQIGAYLRDLRVLFHRYGFDPSVYGHFGMGCVHCRIAFDLMTEKGVGQFRSFMEEATDLVVRYGGSLSGEHGDGQARAEFLPKMFGPELVEAFREFKSIWDPEGGMNPGKIVDPYRVDEALRFGADYAPAHPETHFHYPDDHGDFAHATLRCVGIGECRRHEGKEGSDTMCPSYMVTREEKHSTRGRARLLWEMLQKGPVDGGWKDEGVKEALDLCLACKGCKGDCPVSVDMATYKAEFLSHYYEGRLRPRSAYAFGLINIWARFASLVPGLVNLVTQTPGLSRVAKWMAGVAPERQIPPFAPRTFRRWFERREPGAKAEGAPRVILWADTFNDHFTPETAQAATRVLEQAGFEVVVPKGHLCCGRPLYDYGFLDLARVYLRRILDELKDEIAARTPIVVLEPSCAAVFRDELRSLFPDDGDARTLRENVFLLSEFLTSSHATAVGFEAPRLERKAMVQGHCHHKAIFRFDAEEALMGKMGLEADVLTSGCCGMAGSFGYEQGERYDVAVAAGERALLPAVREAPPETLLLADGFSCREQIEQSTDRSALHLAEALALAIDHGPAGPTGPLPERSITEARQLAVRRSMWRAAALLGGLASAAVAALGSSLTRGLLRAAVRKVRA